MANNVGTGASSSTALLLKCGAAIIVGLLVAAVALGYAGWSVESIIGLMTGIGTVAAGLLVALSKLADVKDSVDQLANGELRQYISATVRAELRLALAERFGPAPRSMPQRRKG